MDGNTGNHAGVLVQPWLRLLLSWAGVIASRNEAWLADLEHPVRFLQSIRATFYKHSQDMLLCIREQYCSAWL
jgi:hypothetical protein